jgi:glutamine synthetase
MDYLSRTCFELSILDAPQMHHPQNTMLLSQEADDPEYGFTDTTELDLALLSFEQLMMLITELNSLRVVNADDRRALERVCDYVAHDPVYADSTRAVFRQQLEKLTSRQD